MTVTLLPLSDGRFSLEFATSDLPSVTAAIRERYGAPDKHEWPTLTEYRFGGCKFTFQNECLISGSAEGDDILKDLYRSLTG